MTLNCVKPTQFSVIQLDCSPHCWFEAFFSFTKMLLLCIHISVIFSGRSYSEARGGTCLLILRPLPKIVSQNEFQISEFWKLFSFCGASPPRPSTGAPLLDLTGGLSPDPLHYLLIFHTLAVALIL